MASTFLILFREGLEALLIVAITLGYLRQTGRQGLVPAVHGALLLAIIGSAGLGLVLARIGGMSPLWEAWLATVAAGLMVGCILHMARHGKRIAADIRGRVDRMALTGRRAQVGLFLFVLLMVSREGIETATLLAALARADDTLDMLIGGVAGVLAAAAIAWVWTRLGRRIDLARFFRVTAIFLGLFTLQLLVYAFHEFTEAEALPGLDNSWWHVATEPYGPEGEYGAWLSYGLALIPSMFILRALWAVRHGNPQPR